MTKLGEYMIVSDMDCQNVSTLKDAKKEVFRHLSLLGKDNDNNEEVVLYRAVEVYTKETLLEE